MTPASIQARAATIFASLTLRLVMLGVIVLLLVNTYADIRIRLPLLPDLHYEGWKPKALRYKQTIEAVDEAQEEAGRLAKAALKAKEREYRQLAERIDDEHELAETAAMDAADRFIASNRMCPADRGAASPAPAAPEGGNPGVPARVPADNFVAVSDADVRACTAATAYAVKAHDWANELVEASATPPTGR